MRFTIRRVDERGKEICEFWRWEIWQDPAGGTMVVSILSSFRKAIGYTKEILLSLLIVLKYMPSINK